MGISFWQILIVAAVIVLLFGRGKISSLMGDVAQGIKSFRKGMKDDDDEVSAAGREALDAVHDGEGTAKKRDTATSA